MINTEMRLYNYFTFATYDKYGQPALSTEPKGQIKMAINILSQSVSDNILFENSSYIGLTTDAEVNSTYVIEYGQERLKVLYVNPKGRYKQVFMERM